MRIGPFELTPIDAGHFRLDGGAMFGVVPKTLWSRTLPADELNRIPMMMRCLLVRSHATGRLYLIDNGCGTKFDAKMSGIYDLPFGSGAPDDPVPNPLLVSLSKAGVSPEEVTDLVFTHLHFDHCGGTTAHATHGDAASGLVHVFPKARYLINARHWETAIHPNAREKASFLPENIEPIAEALRSGQNMKSGEPKVQLLADGHTLEPGFNLLTMDGHTAGQQLPRLTGPAFGVPGIHDGDDATIVFAADLLPLHQHVPLAWVMGYDMAPIQTLKEKERFLSQAAAEGWMIFLEHDAALMLIRIGEEVPGRYKAVIVE
jgi:glyoxylase-like metal-dependent hydrolase (beta-lactamase superfamily II)